MNNSYNANNGNSKEEYRQAALIIAVSRKRRRSELTQQLEDKLREAANG